MIAEAKQKEVIMRLRNVAVTYRVKKQIFSKVKREVHALKDISFNVVRGEKLGVIGRNGAGKSTLFKILAGVFDADSGQVEIAPGLNVQLLTLGLGFEGNLTGRENAVLNGMLLGRQRKYMQERTDAIGEFSELGEFFDMPVHTYSSGMNSRLGFSIALEAEPDVLLIDEVLGVGDASFQKKSQDAMMTKFRSGSTIILVTHNHATIRELCDRAVWIENGTTLMEGPAEEVVDCYIESFNEGSKPKETTLR